MVRLNNGKINQALRKIFYDLRQSVFRHSYASSKCSFSLVRWPTSSLQRDNR